MNFDYFLIKKNNCVVAIFISQNENDKALKEYLSSIPINKWLIAFNLPEIHLQKSIYVEKKMYNTPCDLISLSCAIQSHLNNSKVSLV